MVLKNEEVTPLNILPYIEDILKNVMTVNNSIKAI